MKKIIYQCFIISLILVSCKNEKQATTEDTPTTAPIVKNNKVNILPISHGSLVLEYENVVLYVDPVGGTELYKNMKKPSLILITDIHADHLNTETLQAVIAPNSKIIAPLAVAEKLPEALKTDLSVMSNFQSIDLNIGTTKIGIEAIPMYNLREEALQYHTKDRGNGYVVTLGSDRIYISGDTEDIPEMRALKNIDIAFVCMNLPWTMPVESAADAVLEFKPKKVFPYHYRGTEGLSDVTLFKTLVNSQNKDIEVIQLDWY
ncbi:MBL fold metallo-hydrolase [Lacinutrix iliipiscaria]|uniref:MBL fold metallo-hydrolase n=1 Tax=Lacinutrix iliipiscaria TaxID=1230532 RepID=A0ABW5WQZ2_9FLAO